jgi:hypothetical protein
MVPAGALDAAASSGAGTKSLIFVILFLNNYLLNHLTLLCFRPPPPAHRHHHPTPHPTPWLAVLLGVSCHPRASMGA